MKGFRAMCFFSFILQNTTTFAKVQNCIFMCIFFSLCESRRVYIYSYLPCMPSCCFSFKINHKTIDVYFVPRYYNISQQHSWGFVIKPKKKQGTLYLVTQLESVVLKKTFSRDFRPPRFINQLPLTR
jgi:hypothetical protein